MSYLNLVNFAQSMSALAVVTSPCQDVCATTRVPSQLLSQFAFRLKQLCFLFQVCAIAESQDDSEGSSALIDRRASFVETIRDAELESLKILSGGIAIMMVRATHLTLTSRMTIECKETVLHCLHVYPR